MNNSDRNVTSKDIKLVVVVLIFLLVPIFSPEIYPDSKIIQSLFGVPRLFIFWIICYAMVLIWDFVKGRK